MSTAKKNIPVTRIATAIVRVMIKASLRRGFSPSTSREGGSEASAMAAKVSIIRLIQSIWVMVRGSSVPMSDPPSTSSRAVTFTTNWKKMKRWILR